jgi:hypothetical protein
MSSLLKNGDRPRSSSGSSGSNSSAATATRPRRAAGGCTELETIRSKTENKHANRGDDRDPMGYARSSVSKTTSSASRILLMPPRERRECIDSQLAAVLPAQLVAKATVRERSEVEAEQFSNDPMHHRCMCHVRDTVRIECRVSCCPNDSFAGSQDSLVHTHRSKELQVVFRTTRRLCDEARRSSASRELRDVQFHCMRQPFYDIERKRLPPFQITL